MIFQITKLKTNFDSNSFLILTQDGMNSTIRLWESLKSKTFLRNAMVVRAHIKGLLEIMDYGKSVTLTR